MLESAGRISYVQFLNAVHDEPTLAPSRLGSSLGGSKRDRSRLANYPESAANLLSPAAAENLLRSQLQANTDTLLKASPSHIPFPIFHIPFSISHFPIPFSPPHCL